MELLDPYKSVITKVTIRYKSQPRINRYGTFKGVMKVLITVLRVLMCSMCKLVWKA